MLDKIWSGLIFIGMPVVMGYHLVCGNLFLNTAADDATGLEKWGDIALTPTQYILAGKKAIPRDGRYVFEQKFDYHQGFGLKTAASALACPASLVLGSTLKGLAFLSPVTRERHALMQASRRVVAEHDYRKMGLGVNDFNDGVPIDPPRFVRRPGDEQTLAVEKEALRQVVQLLHDHHIPFWLENGTCIGAFRYGGVIPWDNDIDLAILEPDFDNVMHVLEKLDPDKYLAQDWSSRSCPKAYIRLYIKENHSCIDFSVVRIDEKARTLTGILVYDESPFMPEWWKERERRNYAYPYPFEVIFPLKKGQFDGIEVPVPHQTVAYLQARYGENLDPVMLYNESTSSYEKDLTHPYWQIPDMH